MDPDLASKIRALALAGRCLTREVKALRDESRGGVPRTESLVETERLVGLARMILDPSGRTVNTTRAVSEGLPRASEPGSAPPSALPARPDGPNTEAAPSIEHVLAMCGHGSVLPIPELIGFLGTVGKSGILRIRTADDLYVLEFQQGDIVHGEANCVPQGQRLGDLLVAQGVIDRQTLESACEKGPSWRLGRTLLKRKIIEKDHLKAALRMQVQWLFNRLLREEAKSFTFWNGPPIHAEEGVRLNTTSLLLESARFSDEVEDGLRTLGGTRVEKESP